MTPCCKIFGFSKHNYNIKNIYVYHVEFIMQYIYIIPINRLISGTVTSVRNCHVGRILDRLLSKSDVMVMPGLVSRIRSAARLCC